jgi:ribA/ribD-fused uncharacterized protein
MKLLVSGGRKFNDVDYVVSKLSSLHETCPITLLIDGLAKGVDTIAGTWADCMGIERLTFAADWDTHKKRAGILRNIQMLEEGRPDLLMAFPGGRGTSHMVHATNKAGVDLIQYKQIAFKKEDPTWGFLSNFYPYPIVDETGMFWPSSEHYYQAHKTLDDRLWGAFQDEPDPAVSRRMGRKLRIRHDWDRVKEDVMREAIRLKFSPDTHLANCLLSSQEDHLLELAPWDEFWGSGEHGTGLNRLGWILMERRYELRI